MVFNRFHARNWKTKLLNLLVPSLLAFNSSSADAKGRLGVSLEGGLFNPTGKEFNENYKPGVDFGAGLGYFSEEAGIEGGARFGSAQGNESYSEFDNGWITESSSSASSNVTWREIYATLMLGKFDVKNSASGYFGAGVNLRNISGNESFIEQERGFVTESGYSSSSTANRTVVGGHLEGGLFYNFLNRGGGMFSLGGNLRVYFAGEDDKEIYDGVYAGIQARLFFGDN